MRNRRILVTGAGGFIGHHLVTHLKTLGYWVRGVDIKFPEFTPVDADEFEILDLRDKDNCLKATHGIEEVYALAADMGGMGFISANHADILRNNSLININTLDAATQNGVGRYFYSSSACVYPEHKQMSETTDGLKESDAYPAMPQDAYGWEKLITERLCLHYAQENNIQIRIARFHNIFGPYGTYKGGREKAPAALSRKIAEAKKQGSGTIEIWGDGEQTRSFCYISDCVEAIHCLMRSGYGSPVNIGQDRMVSINELADMIASIAGVGIKKVHIDGPTGVRGRNSDNTLCRDVLGWMPIVSLEDGLAATYEWIESEVRDVR